MPNPRETDDNLGTMVCWHRRYQLGDKHSYSEPYFFLQHLAASAGRSVAGDESFKELREAAINNYVIEPLYLYDHGGITISMAPFTCPWDSGQVGFIYAERKDRAEEEILEAFSKEVEEYDNYLRGEE